MYWILSFRRLLRSLIVSPSDRSFNSKALIRSASSFFVGLLFPIVPALTLNIRSNYKRQHNTTDYPGGVDLSLLPIPSSTYRDIANVLHGEILAGQIDGGLYRKTHDLYPRRSESCPPKPRLNHHSRMIQVHITYLRHALSVLPTPTTQARPGHRPGFSPLRSKP